MSRTTKSPLNIRHHFFWIQKWIQLGHMSQVANFWFSSHNFGNIEIFELQLTRKPKIGNLTNMTELYLFLESKKWYLKGLLWSHDRENHQLDTCSRFSFVSSAFIAGTSTAYNWIAFLWNILSFIWTYQVSVITTQKLFLIFFFWPISQNNLQYMKKIHTEKSEW